MMKVKNKIALVIAAGAVTLGGINANATELGVQNEYASITASDVIKNQVKDVNVNYAAVDWINDPLQTIC